MQLRKMKTAELTGAALDWAVAETQGRRRIATSRKEFGLSVAKSIIPPYSTAWAWCGPLIDEYKLNVSHMPSGRRPDEPWFCCNNSETFWCTGGSAMVAVCRAVVSEQLGDEVDIPTNLTGA
ncbi:phage protein NinX family protein [Cronobacter malonaticus]|uniref:phage protein NinX family protein n=1 Tax=Cronobacter malonaticus TaxID=413503 RepID=UPI000CFC2AC3|nr:phage protein NinX family protein [Cronobacter malonaticus]